MPDLIKFRTRPVYLWDDLEQAFVRSEPNGGTGVWFAKFPHSNEYRIDPTSDIAMRATFADIEVTKDQYERGETIFKSYPNLPAKRF
jgi:hypothetical protein